MNKLTNIEELGRIKYPNYDITVPLPYVKNNIEEYKKDFNLDLNPDFQRGHVWTELQRERFIIFLLRGGKCLTPILFNYPRWGKYTEEDLRNNVMVIVDGLQRLTAIIDFYDDKLKVQGSYASEIVGCKKAFNANINFAIFDFNTRLEILDVYLALNSYGTPHSEKEIERVRKMYEAEAKKEEERWKNAY